MFSKHAGCSRFTYNWGLDQRILCFYSKTGKARFTNYFEQRRELTQLKKTQFPWMYDVSKCAVESALRDLEKAFVNFRRSRKNGAKISFQGLRGKGETIVSDYMEVLGF